MICRKAPTVKQSQNILYINVIPFTRCQEKFPNKTDLERKIFHKDFICEKHFKSISISSILLLMLTPGHRGRIRKEEITLSKQKAIITTTEKQTTNPLVTSRSTGVLSSLNSQRPRKTCQFLLSVSYSFFLFLLLATPCRTGSTESQPLAHQGSPPIVFCIHSK